MKKYYKFVIFLMILILLFTMLYFIFRRVSLNKYLNFTIENQDKFNYSTNIDLTIKNDIYNNKFIYDIDKSYNIKKITIDTYSDNNLVNNFQKYIVLNGTKKGNYILEDGVYVKDEDDFKIDIDYNKLKKSIIKVKSRKDTKKYIKYIVKIKSYNAYNLIYDKDILTKDDYNKDTLLTILIDKKTNFIYKLKYSIKNINLKEEDEYKFDYIVDVTNYKINNTNKINLPF